MTADHLAYKRATSVSLLGMVLQLVLGLVVLVYSFYSRDQAARTASIYVLIGVPAWLVLAIIFDQHRRERIEALEAERFAEADAATSSAFEGVAEEVHLAARRLRVMHRVFLPAVSVVIGLLLLGFGIWRLRVGRAQFDPDVFVSPQHRGWAIAFGLSMSVIGFIFARYVSGMAKQKAWENLRGGASFAVGSSMLGLALAVGNFADIAGPETVLRWLNPAFPVVMIVLGAEVFLNLILDVYRPRAPGQMPRPAFDSRLLGFVAAPDKIAESVSDAINYQFGFNVTSSWFYKFVSKWLTAFALLTLAVIWLMTSFAIVQPHQKAIVLRWGRVIRGFDKPLEPGLHIKAPWPIDRLIVPVYTRKGVEGEPKIVTTHTATGIRTIQLATFPPANKGPILWTNEHATEEKYFLVQPASRQRASGSRAEGSDLAMVSVEVPIHYEVTDVAAYEMLAPPEQRDALLGAVAQRQMIEYLATQRVTDVLGDRRAEISAGLRRRVQRAFDGLNVGPDGTARGAGVHVLFVGIVGAHPPQPTAAGFERVVGASRDREGKIQLARADAIKAMAGVVGSTALASRIVSELDVLDGLHARGASRAEMVEQEIRIAKMLDDAGGKAASLIHEADAARWTTHMGARARSSRYLGQVSANDASPLLYRASMYFDRLSEALSNARLYVTSNDFPELRMNIDVQDQDTGAGVFQVQTEDEGQ